MSLDRDNMDYVFFDNLKKIYVCLNHRVAYLCWIDAYKRKLIYDNALLFHIDHHADFWLDNVQLIAEQESIDINNGKQLMEFVKLKLNKKNTDFIALSMCRGIIGDAISVSIKNNSLIGEFKEGSYGYTNKYEYTDNKGKRHSFFLGGSSLSGLVGINGLLTDKWTHKDVIELFNQHVKNRNIILDIDLDFFTYTGDWGETWAMNERHLTNLFQSEAIRYLLNCINVVSIALEPGCCGGSDECKSILGKLNSLVLRGFHMDIENKIVRRFRL